ncbi:MAG: hypothetical protein KJ768_08695 [Acidobacteria bacterium]|nr:hypothetical protein [Acidobacteriota bacterium]
MKSHLNKWGQVIVLFGILAAASTGCRSERPFPKNARFPELIQSGYAAPASNGGAGEPILFRFEKDIPITLNAEYAPEQGFDLVFPLKFVRPASFYLFSAEFFRTYNVVGVYPEVQFCGQARIMNDFWAQGKTQLLSLVLEAPEEVPSDRPALAVHLPKDRYCFQLSGIRLQALTILPEAPLPGSREKEKFIRFAWDMPETDRMLGIRLLLSRSRDFPGDQTVHFDTDNRYRELLIPNTLDEGRWYWKLEVRFNGRQAALSERGRFSVQGAKKVHPSAGRADEELMSADIPPRFHDPDYFPIGTYGAPAESLPALASMGLNAAVMSAPDAQDLVSLVRTAFGHGIRPLVSFRRSFLDRDILDGLAPDNRRLLQSDAVLGWYLDDEPEGRSISPKTIRDQRDFLRAAGLLQPGAIALASAWRSPDYAPAVDVFMSDQYPVPFNPFTWLSESLDTVAAAIEGDSTKGSWSVIQAFDWGRFSPQARATGKARTPTVEEVQTLCYLSICHGATGLFFYTYNGGNFYDAEHRRLWRDIPDVVRELRDITPVLTAPSAEVTLTIDSPARDAWGHPALHALLKNGDRHLFFSRDFFSRPRAARFNEVFDSLEHSVSISPAQNPPSPVFLIAVNTLPQTVSGRFHLEAKDGRSFTRAFDLFGTGSFTLSDNSLSLIFAPHERKLLLFECRPSGLHIPHYF